MPAYVVITKTRTRDKDQLALYGQQVATFMAGHDYKYLARFGRSEVKEGAAAEGVAIIQFPTFEAAKAWYESAAYQDASRHRFQGGDYDIVIVDGVDGAPP